MRRFRDQGQPPWRRDIQFLAQHHTRPYLQLMGKSGKWGGGQAPWKEDKSAQGRQDSNAYWSYWSGAWKAPGSASKDKDKEQSTSEVMQQFPAYSQIKTGAAASRTIDVAMEISDAEDGPSPAFVKLLQRLLNSARRAEAKIRKLTQDKDTKKSQWEEFQQAMGAIHRAARSLQQGLEEHRQGARGACTTATGYPLADPGGSGGRWPANAVLCSGIIAAFGRGPGGLEPLRGREGRGDRDATRRRDYTEGTAGGAQPNGLPGAGQGSWRGCCERWWQGDGAHEQLHDAAAQGHPCHAAYARSTTSGGSEANAWISPACWRDGRATGAVWAWFTSLGGSLRDFANAGNECQWKDLAESAYQTQSGQAGGASPVCKGWGPAGLGSEGGTRATTPRRRATCQTPGGPQGIGQRAAGCGQGLWQQSPCSDLGRRPRRAWERARRLGGQPHYVGVTSSNDAAGILGQASGGKRAFGHCLQLSVRGPTWLPCACPRYLVMSFARPEFRSGLGCVKLCSCTVLSATSEQLRSIIALVDSGERAILTPYVSHSSSSGLSATCMTCLSCMGAALACICIVASLAVRACASHRISLDLRFPFHSRCFRESTPASSGLR